jgi:hypothetical protein
MRSQEYTVRLALHWLNERYRRGFAPSLDGEVWRAADPEAGPISVVEADLFEASDAWRERCSQLEQRLNDSRPGSYLLWVPPGGELPREEPFESEWVRQVVLAASRLASGRNGEVRLPAKMAIGKLRDEGGYASVTGGLGRYWTFISERLRGSFFLDSRSLNRFTANDEEREQLYEHIALLSQGLETGQVVEFEAEDAWSLQRLPRGTASEGIEDGWAIAGCPEGFDPNDGAAVRRVLRRQLAAARERLAGRPRPWVLVLAGAYGFMADENAGPSLRGFDPTLAAAFDAVLLVADTEVKPITMGRHLPFLREIGA